MSEKFKSTYRGYLVDHHSPKPPVITFDHLDVAEWEKFFLEANIDHLMLYCKDHWGYSYYNTNIGTKHAGLGDRDWVAEVLPVLKKHDIEFTAYYCFEYDSLAPKQHPEWSERTKDGIPLLCGMPTNSSNARWGMPCYETGYREYVLGQLKEIVTNYHPDSLFIDIFGKSVCYCEKCTKMYKDRFGYDMPKTDAEMIEKNRDIVAFLDDSADNMLKEVKALVKSIDPTLALTVNFACHYPKRTRDQLDYIFTEPWAGNWLSGAYARDTTKDQYPQLGPGNVSRVFDYKKTAVYELALYEISAQNCHPFLYSEPMLRDGSLEFEEAQRVGKAYREIEKYQQYLPNREIVADIAIIQSDRADTLRVDQPIQIRSIARAKVSGLHREALLGAMKLCDYSKRTWCLLPEEELTYERIKDYRVLVFPNMFYITDEIKSALDKYVAEGGSVIFSGECGICDEEGKTLPDFSVSNLMGCSYLGMDDSYRKNGWCAYIAPDDSAIWNGSPETTPPVENQIILAKATAAKVLGRFMKPAEKLTETTWVNWGNPMPGDMTEHPAVMCNKVGEGKVYTLCFDFFKTINGGMQWPKSFFNGVLDDCLEARVMLKTETPNLVEYSFFARENDYIMHELSCLPKLCDGDVAPINGGVLQISHELCDVESVERVYPAPAEIQIFKDANGTAVMLPMLELHSIYRIIPKKG